MELVNDDPLRKTLALSRRGRYSKELGLNAVGDEEEQCASASGYEERNYVYTSSLKSIVRTVATLDSMAEVAR